MSYMISWYPTSVWPLFGLFISGYTPAHLAAQTGSVDVLRTLVYSQANINLPDGKSGRTPLHHAVEVDDLPTAGYLLMEVSFSFSYQSEQQNKQQIIFYNTVLWFCCNILSSSSQNLITNNKYI